MYYNPTRQIIHLARNTTCQVPLCCVDECQYKKCDKLDNYHKRYEIKEQLHLDSIDPYWAEFLRAQQQSSANYLYHMQIYGNSHDPTLVKRNAFSPQLIHQRLLHMPIVGALDKGDMFYILSFLLNLFQLKSWKQREVMELLQDQGLLDNETLNYMQIIARHPNTGIPANILDEFLAITHDLNNRKSTVCNTSYFNPDRIFMKCMIEMDPYELEYLKNIMETKGKLDNHQFMYLVNFVERLQEMPLARRDQYLKALHDRAVLPSANFATVVGYIKKKSTPFNRQKLITLWNHLVDLMDIGPCLPQPVVQPQVKEEVTEIDIDALQIQKALQSLMKGGIPNIVRVMDLKKFLQDIMHLNADQLEQTLNQLKNMSLISVLQFKFILEFINNEKLEGEAEQKQLLIKTIQKVITTPPSASPTVVFNIPPPSKGPNVAAAAVATATTEAVKSKAATAVAAAEKTKPLAATVAEKEKIVAPKENTATNDKDKDKNDEKPKKDSKFGKSKKGGKEKSKSKTKGKGKK